MIGNIRAAFVAMMLACAPAMAQTQIAGMAINGRVADLAVSAVSARATLGNTVNKNLLINNSGSADAFCQLGDGTVAATAATSPIIVPAGWGIAVDRQSAGYLACITASSTTTIRIVQGNGSPFMAAAGASSGGTVTANQGSPPWSFNLTQILGAAPSPSNPLWTSPAVGATPTDRTITSATGASQTAMAANAARKSLTIQNTGTANCGVNPTGGTAVIGGAGTITLFPGGAYSPRVPTLAAVTVICTAGQPLYANES